MSDLASIKDLDGHPASFLRFEGPGKFVIMADGRPRTVTRDHWNSLELYRERSDVLDKLVQSG
jgi:hypothetical protein